MTLAEIRELARQAHGEQRDPDGSLHFLHCERVAEAVSGFEAKAAAYLHDLGRCSSRVSRPLSSPTSSRTWLS